MRVSNRRFVDRTDVQVLKVEKKMLLLLSICLRRIIAGINWYIKTVGHFWCGITCQRCSPSTVLDHSLALSIVTNITLSDVASCVLSDVGNHILFLTVITNYSKLHQLPVRIFQKHAQLLTSEQVYHSSQWHIINSDSIFTTYIVKQSTKHPPSDSILDFMFLEIHLYHHNTCLFPWSARFSFRFTKRKLSSLFTLST
jgi:hypothetical protein